MGIEFKTAFDLKNGSGNTPHFLFCLTDKKDGDGTNAIGLDEVEVKSEPDEESQIQYSGFIL